jgi:hypothetical protein
MADVLRDLWRQQRAWSRAADRAKAEVGRLRVASLLLVVTASGLGTAAPAIGALSDPAGRISGLVAGVALGLIPLVRHRLGISMYEVWSRLRSMSEALKVEVFMYLSGVDPYRDEDRAVTLLARSAEVLQRGDDLVLRLRRSDRKTRPLPPVVDVASYLDLRVEPQIAGYYLRKARQMARRARWVRIIQTGLALAAVSLGVVASAGPTAVSPWIGVIGTISGAVIAHSAAARYGFLQLEYYRTAEHLNRLIRRYRHSLTHGPELDDWVVTECERVISYQNEAWMAELVTLRRDEAEAAALPPV